MRVFGNPDLEMDLEFPEREELVKFKLNKKIKLRKICWQN